MMKRLLCLCFACVLLLGCTGKPRLREGYYLLPLEDSWGVPTYFCLESGGTGYLHAMGEREELSWTPDALGGGFSDGVVTEEGLTFPEALTFSYSAQLPPEYLQPTLQPGYYIPDNEELASALTWVQLRPDGTGTFSILGMEKEIEWTSTGFYFGDMIISATADGFFAKDSVPVNYRYTGESLPESYLQGE